MGAGKSTVGAELARRAGRKFVDLDDVIEAENHLTVGEIFQQKGEEAFRKMEGAALNNLLNSTSAGKPAIILALGGGAFAQKANREALQRKNAAVVFLAASENELWRRCALDKKTRPLRQDQRRFRELLRERLPSYKQAPVTVDTDGKSVADIAAEIESSLALFSS